MSETDAPEEMRGEDQAAEVRDPLAAARDRAEIARRRPINNAGGLLSLDEAAERLRLPPQAVRDSQLRGTILAVPMGQDTWRYPARQFAEKGLIPEVDAFLLAFEPDVDAWTRLSVLMAPSDRFGGRTALDLLQEGRAAKALRVAATFGEQPEDVRAIDPLACRHR